MSTENIYKQYNPPQSSGGTYLKFQDDEPVRVRIVSEPVVYESEYKDKVNTQYAWLVWNFDAEAAQVMKLPVTAFRMVADLASDEDWGDPLESPYNLKIKRSQVNNKTVYSINPSVAKTELTEDQQNEIKGLNLVSLVEASPSASKVQLLSDVVKNGRTTKETKTTKQDDIVTDIDKPISLDDIPF
ncbi:MAG TPA: hypothetical protein VFL85_01645 [Candidatus Saccharimonadales bacterium]|nr:hypothetical protein [Candidatus Saccharimonadales bacterium]